jgi:hypothetical protein
MPIPMDEYWADVRQTLISKYQLGLGAATAAVKRRRQELASHGITDLIAHWEFEEIAESIHAQWVVEQKVAARVAAVATSGAPVKSSERRAANTERPLPGGGTHYFQTLVEFLHFLELPRELGEARQFYVSEPYGVTNEEYANNSVRSAITMKLCEDVEGQLILNETGRAVLESERVQDRRAGRRVVLQAKRRVVAGYPAMLQRLLKGPASKYEIKEVLEQAIGARWATLEQVTFRANWLVSLDVATFAPDWLALTDLGIELAKEK